MYIRSRSSVWLLLVAVGCTSGPSPNAEGEIRALLAMQTEAWNAGDIEGYMSGYRRSDSTLFVSGGSRVSGYDSVLARFRRAYPSRESMGTVTFGEVEVVPLSDSVWMARGIWKLVRENDQPWGRFTLLLREFPEGWRVVYDHTSSAR